MLSLAILSMLSACTTTLTIDSFCQSYVPIRNYLDAPESVIRQIDINNNRYLKRCLRGME